MKEEYKQLSKTSIGEHHLMAQRFPHLGPINEDVMEQLLDNRRSRVRSLF